MLIGKIVSLLFQLHLLARVSQPFRIRFLQNVVTGIIRVDFKIAGQRAVLFLCCLPFSKRILALHRGVRITPYAKHRIPCAGCGILHPVPGFFEGAKIILDRPGALNDRVGICPHGQLGSFLRIPQRLSRSYLFILGGRQKVKGIVERSDRVNRIILQAFKLIYGFVNGLPGSLLQPGGNIADHADVIPAERAASNDLRQHACSGMLRDAITGQRARQRLKLP